MRFTANTIDKPGQYIAGAIPAIVQADDTLRRGIVSMAFGFGGVPGEDGDFRQRGSSTSRLVRDDVNYDRFTGQPVMSNIPVEVVSRHSSEAGISMR